MAKYRIRSFSSENYLEVYFRLKTGKDRTIQILQVLHTEKMSKYLEFNKVKNELYND